MNLVTELHNCEENKEGTSFKASKNIWKMKENKFNYICERLLAILMHNS